MKSSITLGAIRSLLALLIFAAPNVHGQSTNIAVLTTEHVDFRILYRPNEAETNRLTIVARDEDHGVNYRASEAVLVVPEPAKLTIPASTPFGNEGDPLWVLPQSQDPSLLYVGFSAEGIPMGSFNGPLEVRLIGLQGPGHFFAWQASEFGSLNVKMNSRDGISADDKTAPIIGSHEHFNFGFSTSGVYRVTLQVEGIESFSGAALVSLPATFEFHVHPLRVMSARPPTLSMPVLNSDSSVTVVLFGEASRPYTLLSSTDLRTWTLLTNFTATAAETALKVSPNAGQRSSLFITAREQ